MTREEIENMPAGRELDKAIAQLLGYTVYHYDKDVEEACYFMLMDAEFDAVVSVWTDAERKTEAEAWADAPEFSTGISASWPIMEKLMDDWSDCSISRGTDEAYMLTRVCWGFDGHGWNWVDAETAPLAICRAALLATLDE